MRLLSGLWDGAYDAYDDDDYDDDADYDDGSPVLRSMQSVRCRCVTCQLRRRSAVTGGRNMWTVDSKCNAMLPGDDVRWSQYFRMFVDQDSLRYLHEKRVINWCSGTVQFYPVKTTGIVCFNNNNNFFFSNPTGIYLPSTEGIKK